VKPAPNSSPKVLLIDDEVDITDAFKLGLEQHGFRVDAYNDPKVALSAFKPKLYSVAILDIRMPEMTGFELYRQLKMLDPDLSVCFLSSFDMFGEEFRKMFPEIDAKSIFRKPISIAELSGRLAELLKAPSRGRSMMNLK
jgi:DNA-binding response OmpR family regulator